MKNTYPKFEDCTDYKPSPHFIISRQSKGPHPEVSKLLKKKGYKVFNRGMGTIWYNLPGETRASLSITMCWDTDPSKDDLKKLRKFLS